MKRRIKDGRSDGREKVSGRMRRSETTSNITVGTPDGGEVVEVERGRWGDDRG